MFGRRWRAATAWLVAGLALAGAAPAAAQSGGSTGSTTSTTTGTSGDSSGDSSGPRAWIVVDAGSGTVLAGENVHEPLPPASTIKLLTALTVVERLRSDDTAMVSETATQSPETTIGLEEGETWRVGDLLTAMLLAAANDATVALAEKTAGTVEAFAELVNETATRLGMKETLLTDPTGVDSSLGEAGTSAFDLAVAARNVMAVPELSSLLAQEQVDGIGPAGSTRSIGNDNPLLGRYEGATGMRVGATDAGGRVIVATATRGDRTIIAVGMDVVDWYAFGTDKLDDGFAAPTDTPGTGERIPPPKVVSADTRRSAIEALPSVLGRPGAAAGASAAVPAASTTLASEGGGADAAPASAPPTTRASTGDSRDGWLSWPWLLVILVVGFLGAFFVRRGQVRRQRHRRLERRRAFEDARRRGMFTVIGDRGPVRASGHVRVVHPESTARRGRDAP